MNRDPGGSLIKRGGREVGDRGYGEDDHQAGDQKPLPAPLQELQQRTMDELVDAPGAYCLAREGELYLVYLPAGTVRPGLRLNYEAQLNVRWFNPRAVGELQKGSVSFVNGIGLQALGTPPSDVDLDWVVVIGN